jgi:enhancing lycopene biosynthesis protein 2
MATRVGVVLSGCGSQDGSEVSEAVLALYWIERLGGRAICMAPDVTQARITDHLSGSPDAKSSPRRVLAEAARIARGRVRDIVSVQEHELDAIIFPGGSGAVTVLSNYAEKGVVCEVHPEVTRLLKALLRRHRPMGFICVDVRPCPPREILVDQKNRVISTPAFMYEDARLVDVGFAIERMVRQVLTFARDRQPRPQAGSGPNKGQGQRAQTRPETAAAPSQPGGVVVRKAPPPASPPGDGSS